MALLRFVNGFTYLKDMETYFEQSYLSIQYHSISMPYYSLSNLLDSLGRKTDKVNRFQELLIKESSHQLVFDGHVIRSSSHENDLSENGNKFPVLKDQQMNVLMAYDIQTNCPLLSKIYEGGKLDKNSIQDLIKEVELQNVLFIVDRGFYSEKNIDLFSQNGNKYIIPLSPNLKEYKEATKMMELNQVFAYEHSKKKNVIHYELAIEKENTNIFVFKDLSQSILEQNDYLKNLEQGKKGFTIERFNELKEYFEVIAIQTNYKDKAGQEKYGLYKKRWKIETFFNYFKNNIDIDALHLNDYYMTVGLSFIMLIVGMIHHEFENKMKEKQIQGRTIDDILKEGRFVKINKYRGKWDLANIKKDRRENMSKLNVDFSKVSEL